MGKSPIVRLNAHDKVSGLQSPIERWRFAFSGVGLVLVAVGYFGPWIPHETAALTVPGSELSWFAKSFGQVTRELFVLPLIAAAVLLGLTAQRFVARPIARLGVVALGFLVILASLPVLTQQRRVLPASVLPGFRATPTGIEA